MIETTGDPEAVVAATRRLSDLGTIVLAGEPLDRRLRIDLYDDVHVRGLRLVGVRSALGRLGSGDTGGDSELALATPVDVQPGLLAGDGAWYRITT